MRCEDFSDRQVVEDVYLTEILAFLREVLGTPDVYIFEWLVRLSKDDSKLAC